MARLEIAIREWRAEVVDEARFPALGADAFVDMERRIKRLARRDPTPGPPAGGTREWIREFVETFGVELGMILDVDPAALSTPPGEPVFPDWQALVEAPSEDAPQFARFAAELVRVAFASEGPAEDSGEEATMRAQAVETLEPSSAREGLDDAETWAKVVPLEYLGQGIVPEGLPRLLRTDPRVFTGWRRALVTVRTVLSDFLEWTAVRAGEGPVPSMPRIGRAVLELTRTLERAALYRLADVPGGNLRVEINAPLFLIVPPAGYDYDELHLELIPSMRARLQRIEFPADHGVRVQGSTLILANWSPHSEEDLARLADVLHQILNSSRRPEGAPEDDEPDERVVAALDGLGLRRVRGRAACWRRAGDVDAGLRPVIHYRQGSFSSTRFQISIVLGLEGEGPLPHELLSQLVRHGEVRVWKDAGLTLLGRIIEGLDELEEEVEAFLAFAEEISLTLREAGAIRPASEGEVTQRLATMPTRLDVDYERLRRFWHRHRQASRLRSLLRGVSPEQAKSHLSGIRDEEDRNYLRSVLVTELFHVDPERALAELRSITPGPERHQSILAVLERAASESRKDLATTVFGLWKEADARAPRYGSRCADILEIAATTLGRDAVLDHVPPDLDASVACEWLTLAFRTYPSTRGDLEWLRRLDSVLLDQGALRSVSLDRLVELHDVVRRHGLPGRRRLIAAVAPLVKSHEYRSYYEDRLGIRLSDEDAAETAAADIERT